MDDAYGWTLDGRLRIHWRPDDDTRINLYVDNPVFFDIRPGASGPGLWIVFSSNPDSADYHPKYFNRCVRALTAAGKNAPPECEEGPRRLGRRRRPDAAA